MDFLNTFLPVILYIVAIILLIVLIIVGIKVLKILNRVDSIVDDVESKVKTFNNAVAVVGKAADGLANISDSVVFGVTTAISKIFNKKMKEEDDVYE